MPETRLPDPAHTWLSRVFPKLWREDPEILWPYVLRWSVPQVHELLAPSAGYGCDRVPLEGGLVFAANHFSGIDPTLLGVFSPRTVWNMAKVELLALPVVGEILQWTGAFPVRRGEGDREALRRARGLVRGGHAVCLFLEGTRQQLGYPGPAQPGASMIAMQEEAPVVPCGLYSFGWRLGNRARCTVVFGNPMSFERIPRSGRGYKRGAELVGAEVLRLWRLAAEAVAGRFPETLRDGTRRCRRYPPFRRTGPR